MVKNVNIEKDTSITSTVEREIILPEVDTLITSFKLDIDAGSGKQTNIQSMTVPEGVKKVKVVVTSKLIKSATAKVQNGGGFFAQTVFTGKITNNSTVSGIFEMTTGKKTVSLIVQDIVNSGAPTVTFAFYYSKYINQ